MSKMTTHVDTVNGDVVEIVLNAPYETLIDGSSYAKGTAVSRFCHLHGSRYCKIEGRQVWASSVKGLLLFAYIDSYLETWGIYRECHIYLPLDNLVYSVEIGGFLSCVPGSESIISLDEALQEREMPTYVLSGGRLTEHFPEVAGSLDLKNVYQFSTVWVEITKHRYFTKPHFAAAGLAAVFAALAISYAPSLLTVSQPPAPEPVQYFEEPQGTDIAVNQLESIDSILDAEINYFLGKGLHTLTYDTQKGVTISGAYPPSDVMAQLIADVESAGLDIQLSAQGWSITKTPVIQRRPMFVLDRFNDNYLVLQRLKEQLGVDVSIDTPSTSRDRRTVLVEITSISPGRPPLRQIAGAFIGRAAALNAIEIGFTDYRFDYMQMTLTLAGKPS